MLRAVAALSALSVLAGCVDPVERSGIEPISVPSAPEVEVVGGGDAGPGSGSDVEVVGGGEAGPGPAGPDPTTAPSPGIDVTTVPDTITPAYIAAVLAELEALYAGALASHVAAGEPTLETATKLGSAFAEPAYAGRLQHFIEIGAEGFVEIAPAEQIRPRTHTDVRLLVVEDDCVYAETRLDVSPVRRDPRPVEVAFVHLGPRDREIYGDVNPTPWLIHIMPAGDPELLRGLDPCVD